MNAVLNLGKYLFALPFLMFGLFHFMSADAMAPMAFNQPVLVYLSGLGLVAAAVSILIGKMDKLATVLLGVMMLLFVFLVHLQGAMNNDNAAMAALLKDLAMAGAAWMYAAHMAKDNTVIG